MSSTTENSRLLRSCSPRLIVGQLLALCLFVGCSDEVQTFSDDPQASKDESSAEVNDVLAQGDEDRLAAAHDTSVTPAALPDKVKSSQNQSSNSDDDLGAEDSSLTEVEVPSVPLGDEQKIRPGLFMEYYDDRNTILKLRWEVNLLENFDTTKSSHSADSYENHGLYEEFLRDGKQLYRKGSYSHGKRDGEWTFWHSNGQVAKTGVYKADREDGMWTFSRKDGTLERVAAYKNGRKDGEERVYFADGKSLREKRSFAIGKRHGTWKSWFEDGEKQSEASFQDGKLHGMTRRWYSDGKKEAEQSFKNGVQHGRFVQWDKGGNIIKDRRFENGKRKSG